MKRLKSNVENESIKYITYTLLLMSSINVFNRYYFFIFGATIIYFLCNRSVVRVNSSTAALVLLACSQVIFDPIFLISPLSILKPFTFVFAYILGYNLIKDEKYSRQNVIIRILLVLSVGMFIHFLLNMIINSGSLRTDLKDIWTNDVSSATLQAAIGTWAVAISVAAIFSPIKWWQNLIAVAVLIVVMVYNFTLAGRTLFIILAIIAAVALIHLIIKSKDKAVAFKILLFVFLIVVIVASMYQRNIFGIKRMVMTSNFYGRFFGDEYTMDVDEDGRMDNKKLYIEKMLDYPWGGGKIRQQLNGEFAHDLYLDLYSEAGFVAFLSIIVFVVISISNLLKIIKKERFSFLFRQILLCIYAVSNIMFFLEPITAGIPWLLVSYCVLDGMVMAMVEYKENLL